MPMMTPQILKSVDFTKTQKFIYIYIYIYIYIHMLYIYMHIYMVKSSFAA